MLEPAVVYTLAAQMGIPGRPHLDAGRALDAELWRRFARLHRALDEPATSALCRQTLLVDAVTDLLARCGDRAPEEHRAGSRKAIERARAFIHDSFECDISLEELALVAGLSQCYLSREFTRWLGVAQHRYQMLVRVERARLRLARGEPATAVAAEAGFTDQSHMIRCFRRVWGMTPGAYVGHGRDARGGAP